VFENLHRLPATSPMRTPLALSSHPELSRMAALHRAESPFGLLDGIRRFGSAFGVRSALFAHVTPDPTHRVLHHLMLACDTPLANSIRNCTTLERHPWMRHAERHAETVCASELHPRAPQPGSPTIDLEGQGFRSALLIPVHGAGNSGRFSLLCLGSHQPGYFESSSPPTVRLLAEALATELHQWWIIEMRRQLRATASLRESDLQLLSMEHEGMSTKEIARVLDISCASVDSRFQRINVRLGCPSRKAAAQRAACYGLI